MRARFKAINNLSARQGTELSHSQVETLVNCATYALNFTVFLYALNLYSFHIVEFSNRKTRQQISTNTIKVYFIVILQVTTVVMSAVTIS